MSLFRKNKIRFEEEEGKTPVKFSREEKLGSSKPKKKRKIKRIVISLILISILGGLTFFGFKGYQSLKGMFEGDTGILDLLSGNQNKPLKGESEGRINVLLLGVGDEGHSGATLSDTVIIASYDTRQKALAMFSVPRDLYVKIPNNYGYAKINAAHAYGEQYNYPGGGPALAKNTVETTFGIPIHYYARVDFSGLANIVDNLGGITVDVERDFCDYDYPTERKGDTRTVCFKKGSQQMNGTKALQYSRSRHAAGPEGSDFARSKRQQKVLISIKEKALSANTAFNPKKVMDLMGTLGKHIKTDLSVTDLSRFYEFSKELDTSKIINKNFDNGPEGFLVSSSSSAGYILEPKTGNFKAIQEFVKTIFSDLVVRNEKAKLGVYNGTTGSTLFNTLVTNLKDAGYTVTTNGNAETRTVTKTVIIDYSNGTKSGTIRALEEKFNVTAQKETGDGALDVKLIIGKDYKG